MADEGSIPALLARAEALEGRPQLAGAAARIFEYTQFLLDQDEHLTKSGGLSGAARALLRARIAELLDGAPEAPAEEAPC